jgi:hypothetical protein
MPVSESDSVNCEHDVRNLGRFLISHTLAGVFRSVVVPPALTGQVCTCFEARQKSDKPEELQAARNLACSTARLYRDDLLLLRSEHTLRTRNARREIMTRRQRNNTEKGSKIPESVIGACQS